MRHRVDTQSGIAFGTGFKNSEVFRRVGLGRDGQQPFDGASLSLDYSAARSTIGKEILQHITNSLGINYSYSKRLQLQH